MTDPWDRRKARRNSRKHRVTFEEALTVADDPRRLTTEDREHSVDEDRYIVIAMSDRGRIIRVTCTFPGDTMRPISARRATKREQHDYRTRH